MNVPFVDLYAQYLTIKDQIDKAISSVIQDSAYIGGSRVEQFEKAFGVWAEREHCVSCANGTDSLEMILRAAGIGSGDEVIVPAISWISTSEVVSSVGAKPVFVDVDDYFLIDLSLVASAITAHTKAIIPVHLYGNPVNMPALMAIADRHNLLVIEDCAQSHGATVNGQKTGTFGQAASFSFYPGKNLGAYGDAGAVVTNDAQLASRIRMIANHGQQGKHNHLIEGRNSRMDGMQAAVLSVKLPFLESWTVQRAALARRYNQLLAGLPLRCPVIHQDRTHVFHLYVIRCEGRDDLMDFLLDSGIGCAIHYPHPLPLLPCYANMGAKAGDFPQAEKSSEILSLPMFPEMTEEQQDYVVSRIRAFYTNSQS